MKRSAFATWILMAHVVVLGLVRAGRQLPPPAQEAKPAPADRDLKTWFDGSSPYAFQFSMTHVANGRADAAIATGNGSVTSSGILHLVVSEPPSSKEATDPTSKGEPPKAPTFDLYKLGETLTMKSPAGAWASFTLLDCEPEVVITNASASVSGFSQKLLSIVGGPAVPNSRAGMVQSLAYLPEPRNFVHRFVSSPKELTEKLESKEPVPAGKGTKTRDVTLQLPYEKTKSMPGVWQVGAIEITVRVDEKLQVSEIVVSLHEFAGERGGNGKSLPPWTLVHSFTSIADALKEEVPADVAKLLQPAPSGN